MSRTSTGKRGTKGVPRLLAILIAVFIGFATPLQATIIEALEDGLIALFDEKADATVRVKVAVTKSVENGKENAVLNVFSGFFISKDGYVLTNAAPNRKDARVWIEHRGSQYLCEVLGADSHSNISLLRTLKLPPDFKYISMSKVKKPRIGSFAFAITHPLELQPTPKLGIVSGYESSFANQAFPFTYMRIGLPIGPGEGGSPYFDSNGDLIGIGVATVPDLDSSYIVPIEALRRIVDDLERLGKVRHGSLPVSFEDKSDPISGHRFVAVASVRPNSLAATAGIQVGDRLVSLDGETFDDANAVQDYIFFSESETFLPLRLLRAGQELEIPLLREPQDSDSTE